MISLLIDNDVGEELCEDTILAAAKYSWCIVLVDGEKGK